MSHVRPAPHPRQAASSPTYIHTYMQRPCRAKVKHRRLICLLGPEDEHPGSLLYLSGRGLLLNTNFHSVGFDACILSFFLPPPTEVILRLSYPLQDRAKEPFSLASHLFPSSSFHPPPPANQPSAARPQLLRRLSARLNLDIRLSSPPEEHPPVALFIHPSNRRHYDIHRQQYYYQSAIL